jgi:hypothetical protein
MNDDSRTRPTGDDEGKDVLDADGERVGLVTAVEEGAVHVETDPGITDEIKAALGWADAEDARTVHEGEIERITDDAVHLGSSEGAPDAGGAGERGTTDARTEPDTGSESGVEPETETARSKTDAGTDPTAGSEGTETAEGEAPEIGAEDEPTDDGRTTTPRSTGTAGSEEDETEVSETPMDDTGDVTTGETTEAGGADEMTETGVDESIEDGATEEMGVPGGEEGIDESGTGTDVEDPATDEPRDAEEAREVADDLDEDSGGPTENPEGEPSVGEAATRGVEEEDAELGSDDEREDRDDRDRR